MTSSRVESGSAYPDPETPQEPKRGDGYLYFRTREEAERYVRWCLKARGLADALEDGTMRPKQ